MKHKIIIILSIFLAVSLFAKVSGQESGRKITISGFVLVLTDGEYSPAADAIITLDGINTGVVTDKNGFYKIKVSPDNKKIGVFTYTDEIVEETINGRNNISFKLKNLAPNQIIQKAESGDEKINIGYQEEEKKNLTAPVGKIDGTKSKFASYSDIYQMIRGEVPGVQVVGKSIMIRSATTFQSTEPMFVVDGVPVISIDNIAPPMVKSIEILKGSAASIYGSRGSNGVILITTLK